MKKSRFTDSQILDAVKRVKADGGVQGQENLGLGN